MYGRGALNPCGQIFLASSSLTEPAMMTSSPCFQFAGVDTRCFAVSWSDGRTALYDAATQAVMEKFSMPTLYQDATAYQADYKELEGTERENLKRVGLLAKQG